MQTVNANIPTVGCPQDGQVDPQDAPALPKTVRVTVPILERLLNVCAGHYKERVATTSAGERLELGKLDEG
jgi:hypothetical protein